MLRSDVEESIKGGTWVFIGSLATSLAGLLFWLVLSNVVGVEAIGMVSMVVSSAGIATGVISAGLNIAIMREIASRGARAYITVLAYALTLGLTAALISLPLISALKVSAIFIASTAVYALISVLFIASAAVLMGLEMFRSYALTTLTASMVKLCLGIGLGILGFKVLAPLLGYLSYPLSALIASTTLIVLLCRSDIEFKVYLDVIKSIAKLNASNYPFVFSTQLLTMLSVYLFAYLIGVPLSTGILYIVLMITLASSAIPVSILSAALPIGIRRSANPYAEGLRVGTALVLPIVVGIGTASTIILNFINPGLTPGSLALKIMLLSVMPLAVLTATIMKLNKEYRIGRIALIGISRLLVLTALLILLSKAHGILGASIAFLASVLTPLPLVINEVRNVFKDVIIMWLIQVAITLSQITLGINEYVLAPIALPLVIFIVHKLGIFTVKDYLGILRIVFKSIIGKHAVRG
ncbi:MAG: hypothetical protein DRO18_04730 [Thermoprotei archaeon]|nr:MAG: hypothetical protein DRO18_04730 [Thermoprotei archaeon]